MAVMPEHYGIKSMGEYPSINFGAYVEQAGMKEDNMASVNVDDLWLVFPELTPASTDDSVGVREQQFANDVRSAAESVRMNNSYDRLRWAFEDASIGIPACAPSATGEVKEEV